MRNDKASNLLLSIPCILFFAASVFLIINGSFLWAGGDIGYDDANKLLKGLSVLAVVIAYAFMITGVKKRSENADEKKLKTISLLISVIVLIVQVAFVLLAKTGIRYDSLKVYDEAVALFSQEGMQASDLGGYFAIYGNNYVPVVITHITLKILLKLHIVKSGFTNGVIVLQLINIIYVDLAFAAGYFILKKYRSHSSAFTYLLMVALCPLTYVWLPFYYTNTMSMPFMMWGLIFMIDAYKEEDTLKSVIKAAASGAILCIGYNIRPTVIIAMISGVITCIFIKKKYDKKEIVKVCMGAIAFICAFAIISGAFNAVVKKYLAFDPTDTKFPAVHWVMMGLNPTGTFTPADEKYTMDLLSADDKKAGDMKVLKERMNDLGFAGVSKLYLYKLANTYADGNGGYHSELSLSKDHGMIWKYVYGTHRSSLLMYSQICYLMQLFLAALYALKMCADKEKNEAVFATLLFMLGSFIFQMIWEAGTIYSIATMCVLPLIGAAYPIRTDETPSGEKKIIPAKQLASFGIGAIGLIILVVIHSNIKEADINISVDQFLFQANEYIALTGDKTITQTFSTDRPFNTVSVKAVNYENEFNDSIYEVTLSDDRGNVLGSSDIAGSSVTDYEFIPLLLSSKEGVTDYVLSITKKEGIYDLIFLYYDTGHVDVYPEGKISGLTEGEMGDLTFQVYDIKEQ